MTTNPDAIPVVIPKEMVNDDAYLIVSLLAHPGEKVAAGQDLAELESSKSSFNLVSPAAGYFYPSGEAGRMIGVGECFGVIASSRREPADTAAVAPNPVEKTAGAEGVDSRFSLSAWELFKNSSLPPERFAGLAHVRRRDVEQALTEKEDAPAVSVASAVSTEGDSRPAVVLLGGGGHCRECIEIIERAGKLRIAGVIDTRSAPGAKIAGYHVLGGNDVLDALLASGTKNLVLAYGISGSPAERGAHYRELCGRGFAFPSIIHPQAAVNRHAVIGDGAQIMAGALVGSQAEIGDACIVNSNCVVSHDCVLGTNVHIAPGAVLAGGVHVGDDSVVGMGATVYMRVRIGKDVIVYNGSHIFADVPDGAVVRGNWNGSEGNS